MDASSRAFGRFDVSALQLLPINWCEQIDNVARTLCQRQLLDGKSATSRESDPDVAIELDVVSGEVIARELPWLLDLYRTHFRSLAATVARAQLYPAKDVSSSININRIAGVGRRYEWHVDSNPITGLLFAASLKEGDGGELLFREGDFTRRVVPEKGIFLAFDAREVPHRVEPLLRDVVRLSIPMNYYLSPDIQPRPTDLDGYLYSGDRS